MSLIRQADSRNGPNELEYKIYNDSIALTGHDGPVLSVRFSPDGHSLATSGLDRQILLWTLPSQEEETPNYGVLAGHKSGVTSVTWRLQSRIFSTSADSTVAFWDSETGQKIRKGVGHELAINDSAASDNSTYISVGDDGTLRVWDERERNAVRTIHTANPLISCAINRNGSLAYASGIEGNVQAYDMSTGELAWSYSGQNEGITGLALSSDESMIVTKTMDGMVYTISARSFLPEGLSREGLTYEGATGNVTQYASKVRFSKGDVYIGLGSEDGALILWSSATQRMVSKLSGHEEAVTDLDFHPFCDMVVSCSSGGDVIVRDF